MRGIFGGLVGAVNYVGGFILFLLIGKKAWVVKYPARGIRLLFGSVTIGLIIAALIGLIEDQSLLYVPEYSELPIAISVVSTLILEIINIIIKE